MALTKVINDLTDLNQSDSANALKGCVGTEAQRPVSSSDIDYLIVGGGGGNGTLTGGAGAGGLLTGTTTVYSGTPTIITIGKGGPAGPGSYPDPLWARNGGDSGFNGIRAIGGGSGGGHGRSNNGIDGGSGGGATSSASSYSGGSGTTGQGMDGGDNSSSGTGYGAGGGGGAGNPAGNANGTGGNGTSSQGGTGGCGTNMNSFISSTNANLAQIGDVSGSDVWFAGGGGGGAQEGNLGGTPYGGPSAGVYANGGGGHGAADGNASQAGLRNTGGGAGGPGYKTSLIWGAGAEGGSGVGVLKYDNTIVTGYSLNSEDTYTVNWPADKYGVAYWPLNLDVKDVGGHYDGTATDITYVTGTFNQAASFNGSSSHIDVSAGLGASGDRTRSVWIYINGLPAASSGETIYYLGATGSNSYYESLLVRETAGASTYKIRWHDRYSSITADDILDSTTTVTTGVWYHIAIVRDGTTQKMYINGSLDNSRTNTYSIVDNTAYPLAIGQWNGSSACCYYEGLMEQLRFYTSALSDSDILDIYNNSKPGSLPPLKTSSDLTTESLSFPSGATTVALWDFNGDLIANPTTYNGANAGAGTITFPDGKFGACAQFNGSNMLMSATQPTLSGGITLSAWVKTTDTAFMSIITMGGTSHAAGLNMFLYNNVLYSTSGPGSSNENYGPTGTTAINTGEWFHVAVTTSGLTAGSTVKAYVNGIFEASITTSYTIDTTTYASAFRIGGRDLGGGPIALWNGEIDQVRIYASTLTDQNIYDLWQKENDIQTHFSSTDPADTISADTDILVFKEGSGAITFLNEEAPGAEPGMIRYNSSSEKMEHFSSTGWSEFNINGGIKNYPTEAYAFWTFNGNANCDPTTYNPGTVSNITYGPGVFGSQAIIFNGTTGTGGSNCTDIPSSITTPLRNSGEFTVSVWINPATLTVASIGYGSVITLLDNIYLSLRLYPSGIMKTILVEETAVYPEAVAITGVRANEWSHVCTTGNATDGVKIYINGVLQGEDDWNGTFATYSSPYYQYNNIGMVKCNNCFGSSLFPYDPHGTFNGSIDQLRIFDYSLTSLQVAQLYNEIYSP